MEKNILISYYQGVLEKVVSGNGHSICHMYAEFKIAKIDNIQ